MQKHQFPFEVTRSHPSYWKSLLHHHTSLYPIFSEDWWRQYRAVSLYSNVPKKRQHVKERRGWSRTEHWWRTSKQRSCYSSSLSSSSSRSSPRFSWCSSSFHTTSSFSTSTSPTTSPTHSSIHSWTRYAQHTVGLHNVHRVSKKLCKIVFVRTSSNFHQFW